MKSISLQQHSREFDPTADFPCHFEPDFTPIIGRQANVLLGIFMSETAEIRQEALENATMESIGRIYRQKSAGLLPGSCVQYQGKLAKTVLTSKRG
jgi:hypothetical protein